MLVEEHRNGAAEIEFYDDYLTSEEESIETMERVENNMLRQLNVQMQIREELIG